MKYFLFLVFIIVTLVFVFSYMNKSDQPVKMFQKYNSEKYSIKGSSKQK